MSNKVVLSVAAHGDDAEFFAGGTLAKLAESGYDLFLLIATNSDRSSFELSGLDLKTLARPEAETAARLLGAKDVFILGYTEGSLCDIQPSHLRGQVMRVIREVEADIVFSWDPFAPFEGHPDHRTIAQATLDAVSLSHMPLYHPEHLVNGLAPHRVTELYWYSKAQWHVNKLVDVSDTVEKKLDALCAYESQMFLAIDELLTRARAAGIKDIPNLHMGFDDQRPWVERAVRAAHGRLSRQLGVDYAEGFRYEQIDLD